MSDSAPIAVPTILHVILTSFNVEECKIVASTSSLGNCMERRGVVSRRVVEMDVGDEGFCNGCHYSVHFAILRLARQLLSCWLSCFGVQDVKWTAMPKPKPSPKCLQLSEAPHNLDSNLSLCIYDILRKVDHTVPAHKSARRRGAEEQSLWSGTVGVTGTELITGLHMDS